MADSSFPFSPADLQTLFDDRGSAAQLDRLGGLAAIQAGLRVSLATGLTTTTTHCSSGDELAQRRLWFGSNEYPTRKFKSFFQLMWRALQEATLVVLCVSAIISLVLKLAIPNSDEGETRSTGWIEGASILGTVAIVVVVTAANDYVKDKQFRKLEQEKDNENVLVFRDGLVQQVRVFDLVVGDIVCLDRGARVPADGLYVSGANLRLDMSSVTGESDAIRKDRDDPFLLSGCIVAEGEARMLVTAVGVYSQWGLIVAALSQDETQTPLQEDLELLATRISRVGLGSASIIFLTLVAQWAWIHFVQGDESFSWLMLEDWVGYFIVSVTILVVAVPEGLPLAVTISLAYSMRKMMRDNNLVRHLQACETMGSVTTICTDKTGTLTENRMTVMRAWLGGRLHDSHTFNDMHPTVTSIVIEGISVNSKAHVRRDPDTHVYTYIGNKTECSLLSLVDRDLGGNYGAVRERLPATHQLPFSSDRKRMSTVVRLDHDHDHDHNHDHDHHYNDDDGKHHPHHQRLHCKGAPEMVLERCASILLATGELVELTDLHKSTILSSVEQFSNDALRTIGLAYRDLPASLAGVDNDGLESELVFIGHFGIEDPLRPEVRNAVQSCQGAGITVRMVTGDHSNTARSIAKQCGILTPGGVVMEGPVFRRLSHQEMVDKLPRLQVLARSTPLDKQLLVERLQELMGEVVAVTGDGTNDAPALNKAHVGLAMGIEGTGVAKQASDIIILDDNFSSIVKSVLWGRNVRENVQKFLQFQLTVNVVALVVAFVAALTGKGTPLKAIQLLWVNLIMDTLAALALGTEAPTPKLLEQPPAGRNYPLVSAVMWRNIIGQAVYQLVTIFSLLYLGDVLLGHESETTYSNTVLFNVFVFCQLFNEINSRKANHEWNVFAHLLANYVFIGILVLTAVLQVLIVEFGGTVFATEPLAAHDWFISVAIGAVSLLWGALVRLVPAPAILCCAVKTHDERLGLDLEAAETRALLPSKRR